MVVGGGPAAVAHPALSEVIQLLEVEETQGTDCCPVRPNRGPRSHEATRALAGGTALATASAWPVRCFPNVAAGIRIGSPFTPTQEKLIIFFALVGV